MSTKVVSTPNGAAEWIVDNKTGILCRANDATALAGALRAMLTAHAGFDRAGIRERVRALFSQPAYARRVRTALAI